MSKTAEDRFRERLAELDAMCPSDGGVIFTCEEWDQFREAFAESQNWVRKSALEKGYRMGRGLA